MTFEEFLKTNWERGFIDYTLKCYNDGTYFYVIPDGYSTINKTAPRYRVIGNILVSAEDSAESSINVKVLNQYCQFPTTNPKFFLGKKVYSPEVDDEVVITSIGKSPKGKEWWYEVEHTTVRQKSFWMREEDIEPIGPVESAETDKENLEGKNAIA